MPSKIPVIIDTDPGVDDVLAILLALASPEIEILAIVVTYGNTELQACRKNIFRLYEVLALHFKKHPEDKARFPNFDPVRKTILARGAEKPLEGEIHSAQFFHGRYDQIDPFPCSYLINHRDGLGSVGSRHPDLEFEGIEDAETHPQLEISKKSGIEVVLEILKREEARSVTYIAIGPLTNLALLMRKDPVTVRERIGRVYSMGGALDVPGNANPVAEFNYYADPYAVNEVLSPKNPTIGIPLERFLMLPLDVTSTHLLHFDTYKAKVDKSLESVSAPSVPLGKAPLTHFTSSFLEKVRELMRGWGTDAIELHDPVAVWCAIENAPNKQEPIGQGPVLQSGWQAVRRMFQVERTGEVTRGMLVADRRSKAEAHASATNGAVKNEADIPVNGGVAVPVNEGVAVVVQTPGRDVLTEMLLRRVWGVVE